MNLLILNIGVTACYNLCNAFILTAKRIRQYITRLFSSEWTRAENSGMTPVFLTRTECKIQQKEKELSKVLLSTQSEPAPNRKRLLAGIFLNNKRKRVYLADRLSFQRL